jgi:hypothetical protein
MSVDNTHIKYLKGKNKKVWKDYGDAIKATKQYDNFFDNITKGVPNLNEGEEYDIPIRKKK